MLIWLWRESRRWGSNTSHMSKRF